jgi:hypothetical protein
MKAAGLSPYQLDHIKSYIIYIMRIMALSRDAKANARELVLLPELVISLRPATQ